MTVVNIFGTLVPDVLTEPPDTTPLNLGVCFKASVNGNVVGVRFYKHTDNTGTHVGNLWSAGGSNLAEVTFSGESASGWQEQLFASPVAITPETLYVISFITPTGHFSKSFHKFQSGGVLNGDLYAYSDAEAGGNGRYVVAGTPSFPSNSFNETWYGVDVMFEASGGGGISIPVVMYNRRIQGM